MRITAKWNGRCGSCGKPTKQGDEIEYRDKKAYCLKCGTKEEDESKPDPGQLELAERLGFIAPGEPVRRDWAMRKMPPAD
jgi:hypothetical protein